MTATLRWRRSLSQIMCRGCRRGSTFFHPGRQLFTASSPIALALLFHHRGTEVTEEDKTRRFTHTVPEQSVGEVWTNIYRGDLFFPCLLCVLGASVVRNPDYARVVAVKRRGPCIVTAVGEGGQDDSREADVLVTCG